MKLENKIAIVTGASSGIGEEIAKRFLNEGAYVIGCGIEEKANIINEKFNYFSVDLRDFSSAKKVVESCVELHKAIDILVNCAGVTVEGTLETTTIENFKFQFDVNVNGVFNMCKAAIVYMKEKEGKSIINIASDLGLKPVANRVAYNPTKAAVISLTQSIAIDYAPFVRANSILPGLVETPMIADRFKEADDPEQLRDLYKSFNLLDRLGNVEDMANAAVFLASSDSSFITGDHLVVSGGSVLK